MGISDFRILQPLGQGSFASVFKVVRKSDEQVYAMKRVNISKMSKKEVSDTLNEIRFLASLRHHNIVAYFESFLDKNDTELCIVMEYCGLGDLAAKVERYRKRRRYIDERQIWQYLAQTCDALKLLHEQGIMHRDVKAANCFLGEDGSVKLGDMNVSKRMEQGLLKTQIGTPYYMSPEIWSNRPYNSASDIWALGCMVYELCALRPPFLADSFPELKRQVQSGQFPPISRNYSYALSTVIAKMLRVNPRERPSAGDMLNGKEVQQNLHAQGYTPQGNSSSEPMQLLETIKVPHNITRLTNQLPKPCYPDKRPNSPDSWPITHRRASKGGRPGSNGSQASMEGARSAAVAAYNHRESKASNNNALPPRVAGSHGQRLSSVKENRSPMPIPPKGSSAAALREGRQQSSGHSGHSKHSARSQHQSPHAPKRYSSNKISPPVYNKRQYPSVPVAVAAARRPSRNQPAPKKISARGGYAQNHNQAQKWWG